jgi:hypothetical protein
VVLDHPGQEPAVEPPRKQELHLHFHGVDAEDVAAILALSTARTTGALTNCAQVRASGGEDR